MSIDIIPLGNNWFGLYGRDSSIEFNPGINPTAEPQDDRNPLASVYRHIDGEKVIAKIYGKAEKSFLYKASDYKKAFELAKKYIEEELCNPCLQDDIFNNSAVVMNK